MRNINFRKNFEWLYEFIDGKNVKLAYETRGDLVSSVQNGWITILKFPIYPFYMSVKGSKTKGIMYDLENKETAFLVKFTENAKKDRVRIKIVLRGILLNSVFVNSIFSHKISFESPHIHILSFPIGKTLKIIKPKNYVLKRRKCLVEVI